jgi:hypothetical protein
MEDQHMKDSSIAASLRESVSFNDIARWNKIFVKWGRFYVILHMLIYIAVCNVSVISQDMDMRNL